MTVSLFATPAAAHTPTDAAVLRERAARHAAEAALATRDTLLGLLAHDLRGPLNTIQTWVHVLEAQLGAAAQDDAAQRAFDGIRAGVTRQVQLLGTHVDTPRAALRASDKPHLVPTTSAGVLEQAVQLTRVALADARDVTIDIAESTADTALYTDANRLEQALWTLLCFAAEASAAQRVIHVSSAPCVLDEPAMGRLPALLQTSERPMGAIRGYRFTIAFHCDGAALVDADLPHVLEAFARDTALIASDKPRTVLALASAERVARILGGTFSHDPLVHDTLVQLTLSVPLSA